MLIAILSDIHGNVDALIPVLEELRHHRDVRRLYVLGDMVGYYYHPSEVLDLLLEFPGEVRFLRGNHEKMLLEVLSGNRNLQDIDGKYGHGIRMALEHLTRGQLEWLCCLPDCMMECLDGMQAVFCHGSPDEPDRYVYPDTSRELLHSFGSQDVKYVFMGHTHRPFFYPDRTTLVNVGSVGQARDYGGMASWCMLNTENGAVTFRHIPYDIQRTAEEARRNDPAIPYLWQVLERRMGDAFQKDTGHGMRR